jgi:hypothetical protein
MQGVWTVTYLEPFNSRFALLSLPEAMVIMIVALAMFVLIKRNK